MSIKRKNIPDGMRDMIFSENKTEKRLGDRICALYEKRGYGCVVTSALEYYDVFNFDSQTIPEENMFKLTDKSGRLVVIRPDNTTPMARIAATRLKNAPRPLKLYYNQNVFRVSGDYSGKRSEFAQTGVEIIGGASFKADLEAIVTALRTLREMGDFYGGGVNFKLELGHAHYCRALLDSFGLSDEARETVTKYIGAKNSSSLDMFGDDDEMKAVMEKVRAIPRLYGNKSVIDKARELCRGVSDAESALDYLENVYDILDSNGFSENISIDLATVNDMDYYTGIVFRGYLDYTGEAILGGGRYDNLMANFGENESATGFGVNLSLATDKLSRVMGIDNDSGIRKTLVHYGDVKLLSKANSYIENSTEVCVLSCFDTTEQAIENAKTNAFSRVVEITAGGISEVWSK